MANGEFLKSQNLMNLHDLSFLIQDNGDVRSMLLFYNFAVLKQFYHLSVAKQMFLNFSDLR